MPNKWCALNYHMHLITCGSCHAEEYTRNSWFTENEVNAMKITKVRADENKLRTGKEWGLYAQ